MSSVNSPYSAVCVHCDHNNVWANSIHMKHLIKSTSLYKLNLLLHRAICNILLQCNVLRLANNVIIHWCWLLLLLLVSYCQRVELLAITFLPHSTVGTTAPTSAAIMNDTVEEEKKHRPYHFIYKLHSKLDNFSICKYINTKNPKLTSSAIIMMCSKLANSCKLLIGSMLRHRYHKVQYDYPVG